MVVVREGSAGSGTVPALRNESLVGAAPPSGTAVPTIRHVGAVTARSRSDDAAVADVLADVESFWAGTLPVAFDRPFTPPAGGYVSIDSSAASGSGPCVGTPGLIAGNAYYCPAGDAIVYDSAGLVPVLLGHYGLPGLIASFAHEFGHAIQARIGPTASERTADPARYPSILIEAQGDCFSGAFLAWAVAGHSVHVRLPATSMVRAVAPLLDFRDPVQEPVGDPTGHGLGVDRLTAILLGYRSGAAACHALTRAEMRPTLGRAGLSQPRARDRFATTSAAMASARGSVGAFAARVVADAVVADASAVVAGSRPAPADLAAAAPFGQFADAATLALAVGRSLTGTSAGAACFTGAWAASLFGHTRTGQLGSWAGDADEALDMLRSRPSATFDELAAYADGFAGGFPACR